MDTKWMQIEILRYMDWQWYNYGYEFKIFEAAAIGKLNIMNALKEAMSVLACT